MISNNECLADDNGIEVLVSYEYEVSEPHFEFGHGKHQVGATVETDLKSVEVIISGVGIDILHLLNKKQINSILDKLTYQ